MTRLLVVALLIATALDSPAGAKTPPSLQAFKVGAVYHCLLTDTATLVFNDQAFDPRTSKEKMSVQIRVQKIHLEMALTSMRGEIYVEKDPIIGRSKDGRSVFAIYEPLLGNIVSLALHSLDDGTVVYTQSKTYRGGPTNVYQEMATGTCRQL